MLTTKIAKNRKKYACEICDYITCNKTDYKKHTETEKHKIAIKSTEINILSTDLSQKSQKQHICECGASYKERTGLWYKKMDNILEYLF
jgi:hypothetical protein